MQRPGLGLGIHDPHGGAVEFPHPAGATAEPTALVEFPDRVSQPGELEGSEFRFRRG
jgi:hypothetical protein